MCINLFMGRFFAFKIIEIHMKKLLRLKHLENITGENNDCSNIIKELFNFNPNKRLLKKYYFKKYLKETLQLLIEARKVDPKKINKKSSLNLIATPNSVDNISYLAMMELQGLLNNYKKETKFSEHVAKVIATTCFESVSNNKYNSQGLAFKSLYHKVLRLPVFEMLSIYMWIEKDLKDSQLGWEKRFLSVHIEDKDYEQAGGNRGNQFNVINTIKNTIRDFNCSYNEAWQMSYALVQTNSYSKATDNFTQDQMRKIKEAKMKVNKGV